jgi:hypothetical protein
MDDKRHKLWDIIIKALGFIATSATIYIGVTQFNNQQESAAEMEFNRNFWQKQNEVYVEVCRSAGTMAANIGDTALFNKEKKHFLSLYYGDLILVEDKNVEGAMRELKSYVDILEPADPGMVNIFKRKVLTLSEACKNSSATFKRANLQ